MARLAARCINVLSHTYSSSPGKRRRPAEPQVSLFIHEPEAKGGRYNKTACDNDKSHGHPLLGFPFFVLASSFACLQ